MSSNRISELLTQVDALSDSYSDLATSLSDAIETFEIRLNLLKGRIPASVYGEGSIELKFQRDSGTHWALFIDEHEKATLPTRCLHSSVENLYAQMLGKDAPVSTPASTSRLLRSVSADVKARAVPLFEPLLEKLVEAHIERRTQIVAANLKLRELLTGLRQTDRGGE